MTDPLFAALPGPVGPLRVLLDARIDELTGQGHPLEPDLALVVRSLADRIDTANATRRDRGFVILTAEYRAARRDLFADLDDGGADPFEAALVEFRAAAAGQPRGPVEVD
jgi:hypothetical protein